MPKLYVVRHAQVRRDPKIPVGDWELSDGAAESIRTLVENNSWGDVSHIYHSPEKKCEQTARIIGNILSLPIMADDNLRELEIKVGYLPYATFKRRAIDFFDGKDDTYFEDFEEAQKRIVKGVKDIIDSEAGKSVVIVSHGRIMMAFYSFLVGYRIGAKGWESIKLPDVSIIDLEKNVIESGFFSGMPIVNNLTSEK